MCSCVSVCVSLAVVFFSPKRATAAAPWIHAQPFFRRVGNKATTSFFLLILLRVPDFGKIQLLHGPHGETYI